MLVLMTGLVAFALCLGCIIIQRRTACESLEGEETSIVFQVLPLASSPFTFISLAFSFKKQEPPWSSNHPFQGPLAEPEPLVFPDIYPVLPATLSEESQVSPHPSTALLARTSQDEIHTFPNIYPDLSEQPSVDSHAPSHVPPGLSEAPQEEEIQTFPDINPPISAHTLPSSAPEDGTFPSTPPRNAAKPKPFKISSPNDPRTRADYLPKPGEYFLRRLFSGQTKVQKDIRDFIISVRSETRSLTKGQLRRLRRRKLRKIWKRFVKEERIPYLRNRSRIPLETGFDLADQEYPCKYILPLIQK
jgi:hypothetical protein